MEITGYRPLRRIYQGPSSLVWRAVRESDGTPVIIKRLTAPYPSHDELTEYKLHFEIASNPPSADMVRALEFRKLRHGAAIVMEDFGGESLASILRDGRLPVRESLRIARRIAAALADIHATGLVLRHLAPSSVILNRATGDVRLTDFRLASLLKRARHAAAPTSRFELAYLAPELTGRTTAAVDYRSDYYSLGAVIYEMLAGEPPFTASDPLDLVYCHLAQPPRPPAERDCDVPAFASAVVMKLLAKSPDERYQSAHGLLLDLGAALAEESGTPPPGTRDVAPGLQIKRLYGREREVATIVDSLASARAGGRHLTIIGGFSGIGKTALAHEALAAAPESRHHVATGKFDQLQRNNPYSAVVAALQGLLRQILSEAAADVAASREAVQAAIAPNGRLLTDLMPELKLLVGDQPPVAELPPTEAQNRFDQVFLRFLRALCGAERPLVLFLDDLQWVDGASLRVIELALRDEQLAGLLVLAAYRDNEVSPSHPFMLAVERLRASGAPVTALSLSSLHRDDVSALVADAIGGLAEDVASLVSLLMRKTGGNPFFLLQFLHALHDRGLIVRGDDGRWRWDVRRIEQEQITENVVDLLLGRMHQLPDETRRALSLAACIGHDFDLYALAVVHGKSIEQTHADLLPGLQEELIASTSGLTLSDADVLVAKVVMRSFRFLHDRIQQAAYALIPEDRRRNVHLRIGRMLLEEYGHDEQSPRLFAIAGHLNFARELLESDAERMQLARIDLAAGRRAKEASAFPAGLELLRAGMSRLPVDVWERDYELALELWRERAMLEYLNADFDASRRFIDEAVASALTPLEQADLLHMLIVQHTLSAEYPEAIAVARRALSLLGIDLTDGDYEAARDAEMAAIDRLLEGRDLSVLQELPAMTNPVTRVAMKLLASLGPPCYRSHQRLWAVIVAMQMRLCLQHGDVPAAAYTYPSYGGLLGYVRGDLSGAAALARATFAVDEKYGSASDRSVAHLMVGASLDHWFRPQRDAEEDYRLAYQVGLDAGNLQYAVYAFGHLMYCRFFRGMNLDEQVLDINGYLEFARARRNQWGIDLIAGVHIVLQNLTGRTAGPAVFSDGEQADAELIERCRTNSNVQVLCVYHVLKAHALWLHGLLDEAAAAAQEAEARLESVATQGLLPSAEFVFIDALIAAALWRSLEGNRTALRARLAARLAQLKTWSAQNPANFAHKALLVEAELDDIDDEPWRSQRGYDESIASAAEGGFGHHEAIASEMAGRFWTRRGQADRGAAYLRRARYGFALWGAHAKVRLLDREFAERCEDPGDAPAPARPAGALATLDLQAVVRASQAIADTVRHETLVGRLLGIVMEHAGADRGFLIVPESDDFAVAAAGVPGRNAEPIPPGPLSQCPDVPAAIVRFVARTGEPVILNRSSERGLFSADEYVRRAGRRAILCMPVQGHGAVAAVLYLENTLSDSAFTADHVEVLRILASQAAISLENSKYCRQMEQLVAERTRALEEANERLRREIERRTRIEAHLAEAHKMESIGRLAGGIAHDFNNHLTVINGVCQLMLDTLPRQNPLWPELAEIRGAGARAATLTQQLLAYSRKQVIEPRPTNLNDLVADVKRMLQRLIGEDIELQTDCAPDLAAVLADPGQISQVLMNLTTNARDALSGSGRITIRTANVHLHENHVEANPEVTVGAHALLSVEDTGCGMTPDTRRHIFDPFFTTKEKGRGTGLGLATVYGIVRQMGGTISVWSEVGQGTRFDIYFPRLDRVESTGGSSSEEPALERGSETVLVVEDQAHVRRLTLRILQNHGYRVLEASDGAQALDVAAAHPGRIDLLLTDVVMPGMTGRELATALAAERPGLKVLFMSGYTADIIAPKGVLDAGMAYLPKPFDPRTLRERVRRVIDAPESAQLTRNSPEPAACGRHP